MFKTQLLLSAARIDELGQYRSPNVCFITPDEDDLDGGQDDQDAGEDADEEAGDGEGREGEESDGGEEDGDDQEGADHEGEDGSSRQENDRQVDRAGPPRRRGASEVIRESKRAAKEAGERAEAAERRAEAAERAAERAERAATERRREETAEQERLRFDSMTTEERYDYQLKKRDESHRQEMAGVRFQVWDSSDRMAFRELAREDPLVARVKDKVEAEVARRQKAGESPVEREIIANQEIAKLMRERQKSAGTRQRTRGAETVRRETARPVRARGNEAAPVRARRGQEDTREARAKRLEGVTI